MPAPKSFSNRRIVLPTTATNNVLPHPALLEMHLSICRALHTTGLGKGIDLFLHDFVDVGEGVPVSVVERVEECKLFIHHVWQTGIGLSN